MITRAADQRASLIAICATAALLTSCSPSPEKVRARAVEFHKRGDYENAVIQYRKLIQKNGSDGEALFGLGHVSAKLRKWDEAYANLKSAVALLPARDDVAAELADLLLMSYWNGREKPRLIYEELKSLSQAMLKVNPRSYSGHRVEGYLAITNRRWTEAKQHFTNALAARPDDRDVSAMLVQTLFDLNETGSGEQLAKSYIARHPHDSLMYEVLVRYYGQKGRPDAAEQILARQVSSNPDSESARIRLAEYHFKAGKAHESETLLHGMLDRTETFPNARFTVGDFYQRMGSLDQALQHYETGAAANPARSLPYHKRQIAILLIQSRFKEARALVTKVFLANPKDRDLRRANAVLLEAENQLEPAIAELRAVVHDHPEDGEARHDLGRALIRKNDIPAARKELEEAVRLVPNSIPARLTLASAALRDKRFEDALRLSEEILQLAPENEAALLSRMSALRSLGRFVEARTILRQLGAGHASSASLDLENGYLLIVEGKPQQAEPILRKLYRPGMDNVRVVAGYVEALTAQFKHAEAIRVLDGDLAAMPNRPMVRFALAETLVRAGNLSRAVQEFRRLVTEQADLVPAYERLSALYLKSNQAEEALSLLRKAKARMPLNPKIAAILAQALESSGKDTEAGEAYGESLRLDPQNHVASNNLAYLLAHRNVELEKALKLVQHALQRSPDNPLYRDTLGYVYLRQGEKAAALQIFKALVTKYPEDLFFRYHYGLALWESGDKQHSKSELARVLKANPSNELKAKVLRAISRI